MLDPKRRGLAGVGASFALVGVLGMADPGRAGTGRLLSSWMSRAPAIDGQIDAGEWEGAALVDLGAGILVRLGNDHRTLYLSVLDTGDPALDWTDILYLAFDDEGGSPPILDDGAWTNSLCQDTPNLGEGIFHFRTDQSISYAEWIAGTYCVPYQEIGGNASFHVASRPEGLTYEVALPLDGPLPLRATPGRRFGVWLRVQRDGAFPACLPSPCGGLTPFDYRNLVLASGGCNTGPQGFGDGPPWSGLPLDWTSLLTVGSGTGWVQSTLFADPVFCQDNSTGGSGAAACVSNAFHTSARTDSQLRMPMNLAGQSSATVRALATLVVDPNGAGTYEYLDFGVRRQDGTGNSELFWLGQDQSGAVVLPLSPGGGAAVVEFWFTHSAFSAGGIEGGFAQVDDVEVLCGPTLFADGFESGLTTHWGADGPQEPPPATQAPPGQRPRAGI